MEETKKMILANFEDKDMKNRILFCVGALFFMVITLCGKTSLAATDYTQAEHWAVYAEGQGESDVFFVCPTVDMGKNGNKNMNLEDATTKTYFLGATRMELGIYNENAVVYAPYYQQVTFPVYSIPDVEAAPYFDIAYADVKAAFATYLEQCDVERPLILAGFSQGADMVLRLLKDYGNDASIANRLVAAYAIGWRLTREDVENYPWLVPAANETDIGCIVLYDSEAEGISGSLLVPKGVWTYSINPLNWNTDATPAEASENLGACFTDYSGGIVKEVPALTGATINPQRGTLICTNIVPADYANSMFPDGVYHLYDYQFFYRNLQKNVALRLEAWRQCHQAQAGS